MLNLMNTRSYLYVPCNRERYYTKAIASSCDAVIFDLEDSVSLLEKHEARQILLDCGRSTIEKCEGKVALVRINSIDTDFVSSDIAAAIAINAMGIILPKASARSVKKVESMIFDLMGPHHGELGIIPLIESAFGLETIWDTLNSSSLVIGAQFGAEDYTKDLQIMRTSAGKEIEYARNRFTLACRAKGIASIDTPFVNFKDVDGLIEDTMRVKAMGMTGKTCIHPSQIIEVNRIFMPSKEEIEISQHIVDCWEHQNNSSKGVIVVDGQMIDKPIYYRAQNILKKVYGVQ